MSATGDPISSCPASTVSMSRDYGDLLDILGEVSMEGYCDREYRKWEEQVAEPRLVELGYEVRMWTDGERDSFGPLSRIVITVKDGQVKRLIYG